MGRRFLTAVLLLALTAVGLGEVISMANLGQQGKQFQDFKNNFTKKYSKKIENDYRLSVFSKNKAKIDAHNSNPKKTHTEELNQFSDLTETEFASIYLNLIAPPIIPIPPVAKASTGEPLLAALSTVGATSSIDWTTSGKVTAIRNQGSCGSCWAFSAVAVMESAYLIVKGISSDFSEQQLVDCSTANFGCGGGSMSSALGYIKTSGLNLQSAYVYKGVKGSCKLPNGPYKIISYARVFACTGMITAILKQPMTVAVDATNWSAYRSGIFSNCNSTKHNHGVALVGYNSASWKVKNSWGKTWGESGFIRLAPGNTCGICLLATSVTV